MRPEPSAPVHSESERLIVVLVITRARALARARKFEDAVALVDSYQEVRESLIGREFFAKLTTLRGDYKAARIQWAKILTDHPEHREAKEMVEAIDLWSVRPPWLNGVLAAAAIATILCIAGIGYFLNLPDNTTPSLPTPKVSVVPTNAGTSEAESNLKAGAESQFPVITFSLTTSTAEKGKKN